MTGEIRTEGSREDRRKNLVTVGTQTDEIGEGRGRDRISVRTQTDEIGEGRGMDWIPVRTQTRTFVSRLAAQSSELLLLPGLPNEITLDRIVPKLPWSAIKVLGSVSRCWEKAIRRHQVYDARGRFHSRELFVVLDYRLSPYNLQLALYSMRDEYLIPLPPIPNLIDGNPPGSECVSLDGKVYVVGGMNDRATEIGNAEVFVLDLAGQRQWKKCASMLEGRYRLGCAVMHGKIYVFGGMCSGKPVFGWEVYDPGEDTWTSIMSTEHWRSYHKVATMGEELFVHGGFFLDPKYPGRRDNVWIPGLLLEIYNPTTNEWKLVGRYENEPGPAERTFVARGKFHRITLSGIDVYNFDENRWTILHLHSFASIRRFHSARVIPKVAVPVKDELLLCVFWYTERDGYRNGRASLLQSKGFESENAEILWEIVGNCCSSCGRTVMCPIQL